MGLSSDARQTERYLPKAALMNALAKAGIELGENGSIIPRPKGKARIQIKGAPTEADWTSPCHLSRHPAAILAPYTESLLAPGKVTLAWIRWPIGCPGPAPNRQDHQQKGNDNQGSVQQHGLTHHVRGWLGPGPELPNRAVPVVPAPPNCDRTAPPLLQSGSGVLSW
jgi:hypothetical protein